MTDKEHNELLANQLRSLADYISVAEGKAKVKIGITFRLNRMLVKLPVAPASITMRLLALWAADQIKLSVANYQKATGKTDGQDIAQAMDRAIEALGG